MVFCGRIGYTEVRQGGRHMEKVSVQAADKAALLQYGLEAHRLSGVQASAFAQKEVLLRQGEEMECLYLVVEGTAKICINARNGKNLIMCYYVSDGILGDVELMRTDRSASTTVIAVSPLRAIAIPIGSNEAYLKNNLAFMNRIAASLSEKLIGSSTAHAASALYTSEERLCAYILMAERHGFFSDILTEVAQSVGMSYRHVFRVVNALCADGVLEKTECGYKVLDRSQLRRRSSE